MNKIRLLCIGHEIPLGGGMKAPLPILDRLNPNFFDLEVWFLREKGSWHQKQFEHFSLNFFLTENMNTKYKFFNLIFRLWKLARKSDIIFAIGEGAPMYLCAIIGKLAHKPVVGWIHVRWADALQIWYGWWHTPCSKLLFPLIDQIITVSTHSRDNLNEFIPKLKNKTIAIPNSIDIEHIQKQSCASLPDWADKIFSKKTILAVGGLLLVKQFHLLIEAFHVLINQGKDFNLLILGEGDQRPFLEDLIAKLNLSDSVFLPGIQHNPYPFFRNASLLCMCSKSEGFSLVLLEAMVLKTPIVALETPAAFELLKNGLCGYLVSTTDPLALSNGIAKMIESPDLRNRFIIAGSDHAKQFELTKTKERFEELFKNIKHTAYVSQ